MVRTRPDFYAQDVLQVAWWHKQIEIAQALVQYRRVYVKAGNGPGKTFLGAGLVNWFYDLHPRGLCLTTASTSAQVKDVLWKEVRVQRAGRSGLMPKAPRMEDAPDHFAVGYTAASPDAFQGRHAKHLMMLFDEATGITGPFWDAAEGMQPQYWLVMLNPTDTGTRAYEEEQKPGWHVVTLNGLEHPNVLAELVGQPAPYPESSLRLSWVQERVRQWCTPIGAEDHRAQDVEWPPASGQWVRPGPIFEARVLGRWPTAGSTSVWTEALWEQACRAQPSDGSYPIPEGAGPLEIGCDVARHGDDFTSILVRRGRTALWHETHNGWDTSQTAGRLKQLCRQFATQGQAAGSVPVKVDDDGVGGGVTDQGRGATAAETYRFIGCSGAHKALLAADYPNRRSEVWFSVAEACNEGRLDLSRLSDESRSLLRRQLMAPTWKLDAQGRRVVEPKAETKKRIGRSPDDADALNLAYGATRGWTDDPELLTWFKGQ